MGLSAAVAAEPDVDSMLRRYQSQRRRDLKSSQRDADRSRRWFERADRYLGLDSEDFAALLDRRRSPLVEYLPPRLLAGGRRLVKRTGLAAHVRSLASRGRR